MALVRAELVFAEDGWRRDHAFVVQGGRIAGTGEPRELRERFPEETTEDWGGVAVLPGTVNAHAHSSQALLRGQGDELTFGQWRDRVLYPRTEAMDRDAFVASALFDFAQMAKAGITTTVDVFSSHDHGIDNDLAVVEAARRIGIRVVVARSMCDWAGAPQRSHETPAQAERNFRDLHAELRGDRTAFVHPAPESPHAASAGMITTGAALAQEFGLTLHIHCAQRRSAVEEVTERTGLSPVAYLDSLGVLSERTLLADAVWVDGRDLALIEERGTRVVHNPSANASLGDGVAPVRSMLERGIPVCLGTGGGGSNGRRSVFEEMRVASLVARARDEDASALTAEQAVLMGTARGGAALGLPVGRIAEDHAADLVVLDLDALALQPRETAPAQVVASMQPDAIARVIVNGETLVERGRLTRIDEAEILAKVREATQGYGVLEPAGASPSS
jgi:5-methylthioadenosine/S-adenosylhomocysteine deaminase